MLKKIKSFLKDMIYSPSGTSAITFLVMLFLAIFNLLNTAWLFSNNWFMIPMLAISFLVPLLIFRATRGGKKYVPTTHFNLPRKHHISIIVFAILFMAFGSTFLKLAFIEGKYVEFPLYSTFFAHRNGKLFTDLYLVLSFCIIPPVLEGLIFRGVIIKEHENKGRMTVTIFSAFFFALLGFSFELFIPNFFVGVVLCMVLYATESLATAVAIHIAYNFFAVFLEPTFVSVKSVSANYELFAFIVAIFTLIVAILFFSRLSRFYQKSAHDKFGKNSTRSTSRERTFWNITELLLSIPAIACYVLFIIVTLIANR